MLRDQVIVQDNYIVPAYYPAKTGSIERKFEADRAYGGPDAPPPALYTRAGCNSELDNTKPRPPWSIGPNLHGAVYGPRVEQLAPHYGSAIESMVGGFAAGDCQLLIFILLIVLVVYQFVMLRKISAKISKLKHKHAV